MIQDQMITRGMGGVLPEQADISTEAGYRAGHFFTPESDGVTGKLAALLHQHGLQDVQTRAHILTYQAGTPEGQHFYDNMRRTFRTVLTAWGKCASK